MGPRAGGHIGEEVAKIGTRALWWSSQKQAPVFAPCRAILWESIVTLAAAEASKPGTKTGSQIRSRPKSETCALA